MRRTFELLAALLTLRGKSRDVTIELVPNATHNYLSASTGSEHEFQGLSRFVPGIHDRIVDWAAKRILCADGKLVQRHRPPEVVTSRRSGFSAM
jgi:hypothetical protein